jgi:hypothetical protein
MLPKNLKYQNKVESASANAYTSNIAPQNGTGPYSAGQTIIINIPTRQNLCLIGSESTLKFSLAVTPGGNAAYVRLDRGGANGVIQRLRLYSGSNLLEDVDAYGLIMANLISLQKSTSSTRGKFNISNGTTSADMVTLNTVANQAWNAANSLYGNSYIAPRGEKLLTTTENANVTAAAGSTPRTYSISLLSILGTLGSQYVPLFAMTSSPLRLELQLVSNANMFCCSDQALASFSLTNVEYVASFLELSDSSMSIINQSLGGQPLQYVIPSFRNYVYTYALPTTALQVNAPIPAKFSSLKSLFGVMRDNANTATTFFPMSSCHYNLSSYNLRIGSKIIPAKAPSTVSEFFIEACKAVGSVSDINHCPSLNMFSYNKTINAANTETAAIMDQTSISNTFIIGCDLEVYSNADKESIFSGYNSTTDDIFIQLQFGGVANAIPSLRFDFFALYDSLLVCENSTAYCKF